MRGVAVLAAVLLLTSAAPAAATSFETPEDAVSHYLEGLAGADLERVLEASALDELRDGYQLGQMVDHVALFDAWTLPGPVHDPFFADVQLARWQAERLGEVRMLAYSLLAPDLLGDVLEGFPTYEADVLWADELMAKLDASRLSSLVVADIALPEPEMYGSPFNLENNARSASIYGADEQTDRVVLFTFEDEPYVVGFTLLRYGDEWKVLKQASAISGLPPMGTAQPMTVDEFESLTSG